MFLEEDVNGADPLSPQGMNVHWHIAGCDIMSRDECLDLIIVSDGKLPRPMTMMLTDLEEDTITSAYQTKRGTLTCGPYSNAEDKSAWCAATVIS